jgi:hypothetical protein
VKLISHFNVIPGDRVNGASHLHSPVRLHGMELMHSGTSVKTRAGHSGFMLHVDDLPVHSVIMYDGALSRHLFLRLLQAHVFIVCESQRRKLE